MSFKKSMVFLLACCGGTSYSAAAEDARVFRIKEPALWRQPLDKRTSTQRVIIALQWPDGILEDHLRLLGERSLYALIKPRKRTEILVVVSCWEQVPEKLKQDPQRVVFVTHDLQAFYYPERSQLVVFPSHSFYRGRAEGIPAVKGDYEMYNGLSFLIGQVIRYISVEQKFVPTEIIGIGTAPRLETLKNNLGAYSVSYFCLEPLEEGKPSPVAFKEGSLALLEGPSRPIARKPFSLNPDDPYEFRGIKKRLESLQKPKDLFPK
jgi:hypothetical protein